MKTRKQRSNFGKVVLMGVSIFTLGTMAACGTDSSSEDDVTDNDNQIDSVDTVDNLPQDSLTYEVDTNTVVEDSLIIE